MKLIPKDGSGVSWKEKKKNKRNVRASSRHSNSNYSFQSQGSAGMREDSRKVSINGNSIFWPGNLVKDGKDRRIQKRGVLSNHTRKKYVPQLRKNRNTGLNRHQNARNEEEDEEYQQMLNEIE